MKPSLTERLREAERRYQSVFFENPQPMLIFDRETLQILEVNVAACEKYGYHADEFCKLTIIDIRPEEDIPILQSALKNSLNTFNHLGVFRHKKKNGEIFHVELSSYDITYNSRPARHVLINDVSQNIKNENQVQDDRRTMQILSELINDYIFRLDADARGKFVMSIVAGNYVKATGRSPGEIKTPDDWYKTLFPEDLPKLLATFQEVLAGKPLVVLECRSHSANGALRWLEITATPVFDETGSRVKTIYGAVRNISDRKTAEKTILDSERKFRNLYDTMSQGVIYYDQEGRITTANASAQRILGLTFDQMVGKSDINRNWHAINEEGQVVPPENYPVTKALKSGNDQNALMGVYNPNTSKYTWIRIHAKPEFREGEERPFQVYATFEDITTLKNALSDLNQVNRNLEEVVEKRTHEIKQLSKLQEAILRNAGLAIISADPDGTIRVFNQAAEQMLGYSEKEMIGKETPVVFHDNNELALAAIEIAKHRGSKPEIGFSVFSDMLEIQSPVTREWTYIKKNGEKFPVNLTVSSISDDSGNLLGYLGIAMDITGMKKTLDSLKESEERFHRMFHEHAAIMLLINPATGQVVDANRSAASFYGYNFHDTEPVCIDQITPVNRNEALRIMEEKLSKDPSFYSLKTTLASGEERLVEVHSTPISVKGEILLFSIIQDITERKNSQEFIRSQRDLANALSTCAGLDCALSATLDAIMQLAGVEGGGIYLYDQEQKTMKLAIHRGLAREFISEVMNFIPDDNQIRKLLKGEPLIGSIDDVVRYPQALKFNDGLKGVAIIPVMHEGKPIGTINVGSRTSADFHTKILYQLEAIAYQIGGVISRIHVERALLSSQANFKKLFDTIDDFLFILDTSGNIILTNQVVQKRLGYSQEELKGQNVLTVHPPARREEAGFIVSEMLAGRKSFCPVPLITRDNSLIPVETRVILGKWDDQDALFGISRDITERQKAEAALRMQSSAFESFALAIIITDTNGVIQWANSAFSKLSGYTNKESIGRKNSVLIKSGVQTESFYARMWETISSGNTWSGELINRRKNGSVYPEELTITPVFDHEGSITNYIAIKIDITKRRELEKSLIESINREKELSEMKSMFISVASHEFKTPLATILASSETLINYHDRLTHVQKIEKLHKIQEKVGQMNKIVEDMLLLSKLQTKKQPLKPVLFDLAELCRVTIAELKQPHDPSNRISMNPCHGNFMVVLDRNEIHTILTNLLTNALKYTPRDKEINVTVESRDEKIILTVADQGIGIPEHEVKHLFEPFFRASNVSNIPGTGLGLNIVKESVSRHHGKISVNSKPGEGTTIKIILPIKI